MKTYWFFIILMLITCLFSDKLDEKLKDNKVFKKVILVLTGIASVVFVILGFIMIKILLA